MPRSPRTLVHLRKRRRDLAREIDGLEDRMEDADDTEYAKLRTERKAKREELRELEDDIAEFEDDSDGEKGDGDGEKGDGEKGDGDGEKGDGEKGDGEKKDKPPDPAHWSGRRLFGRKDQAA